ncbi:hypothetical protein KP78_05410 [Jeotgalibacillus soli]|uniref:Uncharacterized protein n=1 Tax=Jeotgalibacillus soli TaxID=889306 RepID=A0A0C2W6G7_9BACL|nr:hypothetical protein KP78_05410 [Jeotgalibacillus soli]
MEWIVFSTVATIAITMLSLHLLSRGLDQYFNKKYNRSQ